MTWKDIFCLAFYLKRKKNVLIEHILSGTIWLFCFCVLFSNLYLKIEFTAKHWSDLCNYDHSSDFLEFSPGKIFCEYCENFRKIEPMEFVENLPQIYLPYRLLHNLHSFLLWEKVKIFVFVFFKKRMTRIKLFLHIGSHDKWFCIKSWQIFANLLLLCKVPRKKNYLLKDVESTVVITLDKVLFL